MTSRATPNQQRCIDEPGHLVVVAGPGAGKTSTVISKVAELAKSPANRIVCVSFTRDSAREMKTRAARKLSGDESRRVTFGTFHSLTIRHLDQLGQSPKLIEPAQQRHLLNKCLQHMTAADRSKAMLQFEAAKCSLQPVPEIEDLAWFAQYQAMLQRHGKVDLYDIMRGATLDMANGRLPTIPCTHLIVDEVQDVDAIQHLWFCTHTDAGAITTIVGDDDQTIYEWRRAIGYPGMRRFAEHYQATVVALGENFRSLGNIVRAADSVISNNAPNRLRKDFVPRRGSGGRITIDRAGSLKEAAAQIAERIRDHATRIEDQIPGQAQYEVKTGSWAVLTRSNRAINHMQAALSSQGVKCHRNSGSIFELPPAVLMQNMLITLDTAEPLGFELGLMHLGLQPKEAGDVIAELGGSLGLVFEQEPSFQKFSQIREQLEQYAKRWRVWRRFLKNGELIDAVSRIANFIVDNSRSGEEDMTAAICEAVMDRVTRQRSGTLSERVRVAFTRTERREPDRAVELHTLHSAKGLEWTNVVLLGMDDESIPGDVQRLGQGAGAVANLESERRLFYVGMTRAADWLIISHTAGRGSRFISEIPSDLVS